MKYIKFVPSAELQDLNIEIGFKKLHIRNLSWNDAAIERNKQLIADYEDELFILEKIRTDYLKKCKIQN